MKPWCQNKLQNRQDQKIDKLWNSPQQNHWNLGQNLDAHYTVMNGYSYNSYNSISTFFPTMFPESPTAEYVEMRPEKLSHVLKFGIAPFFKRLLKGKTSEWNCHVVSFDESFNGFTQACQIDLLIRYQWPLFAREQPIAEMNQQFDVFRDLPGATWASDCG